jgi:hypothetical protein
VLASTVIIRGELTHLVPLSSELDEQRLECVVPRSLLCLPLSIRAEHSLKVAGGLVTLEKIEDQVHEIFENDEEEGKNEQAKPKLSTRHSRHADSEVVGWSESVHQRRVRDVDVYR